jgi:polysaccharide deacetylase 2 family uncharacterized protein YibQ
MAKGKPRKRRADRRARAMALVRFSAIAAAVAVVVLLGIWEFVASGRAGDLVAGIAGPGDLVVKAREIDGAIDASLVRLGVTEVESESEEREGRRRRWLAWDKSGKIPYGVGTFECNLSITEAVREAGGRIVRVSESDPDWRGLRTIDMRFGAEGVETHRVVLKESVRPEGAERARAGDGAAPRIAIVIDDIGYANSTVVRDILTLDVPLSVSILPGTPHGPSLARRAAAAGREVLLHLPMQPEGYPDADPGDRALLLEQTHREIASRVADALADVPEAMGVNNHMGSAFTRDRGRMRTVMGVLKERGLFFVDSMTTPQSTGFSEARRAGVRSVRNNMFIDSRLDELGRLDVYSQLLALQDIARKRGAAVGIGHPHPETLRVLKSAIPEMKGRGFEFVLVSELTG